MLRKLAITALTLASLAIAPVQAQQAQGSREARDNPSNALKENAERGWFFYERNKKPPEEPKKEEEPVKAESPPPPKEDRCKKKETWTADCGFVDPGKDFDFQSKQRDALLQAMSMSQNDPKTVENFQYYMKWLMERSIEVANLWQYNLVQNPELDANVKAPINTFGLKLMTQVKDSSDGAILQALKEEKAFLLYFSKYDCEFCHAMSSVINDLAHDTQLTIWNASLDDKCMPKFEERCRTGDAVIKSAQALQVTIVPTLFLYVPGSKPSDDTWIRIATGVTDSQTMKGRIVSFFTAYRTALLKGVNNSTQGRASVDFSENQATGAAEGVRPSQTPMPLPTEAQIKDLFAQ